MSIERGPRMNFAIDEKMAAGQSTEQPVPVAPVETGVAQPGIMQEGVEQPISQNAAASEPKEPAQFDMNTVQYFGRSRFTGKDGQTGLDFSKGDKIPF